MHFPGRSDGSAPKGFPALTTSQHCPSLSQANNPIAEAEQGLWAESPAVWEGPEWPHTLQSASSRLWAVPEKSVGGHSTGIASVVMQAEMKL